MHAITNGLSKAQVYCEEALVAGSLSGAQVNVCSDQTSTMFDGSVRIKLGILKRCTCTPTQAF